jgi:hypothetical protein
MQKKKKNSFSEFEKKAVILWEDYVNLDKEFVCGVYIGEGELENIGNVGRDRVMGIHYDGLHTTV